MCLALILGDIFFTLLFVLTPPQSVRRGQQAVGYALAELLAASAIVMLKHNLLTFRAHGAEPVRRV
jgi:hypothetical protein